ncbi:hypothetical protein HDU96_011012 [Phlyctochytrium bullatum]|nr:hypothetical protein HDU96_011012 [Phlyctochytrium bullatum]
MTASATSSPSPLSSAKEKMAHMDLLTLQHKHSHQDDIASTNKNNSAEDPAIATHIRDLHDTLHTLIESGRRREEEWQHLIHRRKSSASMAAGAAAAAAAAHAAASSTGTPSPSASPQQANLSHHHPVLATAQFAHARNASGSSLGSQSPSTTTTFPPPRSTSESDLASYFRQRQPPPPMPVYAADSAPAAAVASSPPSAPPPNAPLPPVPSDTPPHPSTTSPRMLHRSKSQGSFLPSFGKHAAATLPHPHHHAASLIVEQRRKSLGVASQVASAPLPSPATPSGILKRSSFLGGSGTAPTSGPHSAPSQPHFPVLTLAGPPYFAPGANPTSPPLSPTDDALLAELTTSIEAAPTSVAAATERARRLSASSTASSWAPGVTRRPSVAGTTQPPASSASSFASSSSGAQRLSGRSIASSVGSSTPTSPVTTATPAVPQRRPSIASSSNKRASNGSTTTTATTIRPSTDIPTDHPRPSLDVPATARVHRRPSVASRASTTRPSFDDLRPSLDDLTPAGVTPPATPTSGFGKMWGAGASLRSILRSTNNTPQQQPPSPPTIVVPDPEPRQGLFAFGRAGPPSPAARPRRSMDAPSVDDAWSPRPSLDASAPPKYVLKPSPSLASLHTPTTPTAPTPSAAPTFAALVAVPHTTHALLEKLSTSTTARATPSQTTVLKWRPRILVLTPSTPTRAPQLFVFRHPARDDDAALARLDLGPGSRVHVVPTDRTSFVVTEATAEGAAGNAEWVLRALPDAAEGEAGGATAAEEAAAAWVGMLREAVVEARSVAKGAVLARANRAAAAARSGGAPPPPPPPPPLSATAPVRMDRRTRSMEGAAAPAAPTATTTAPVPVPPPITRSRSTASFKMATMAPVEPAAWDDATPAAAPETVGAGPGLLKSGGKNSEKGMKGMLRGLFRSA